MTPGRRNLVVWCGTILIGAALWWFTVRISLQFVNPVAFLIRVAIAAAALTALLWWDIAAGGRDRTDDDDNTTED